MGGGRWQQYGINYLWLENKEVFVDYGPNFLLLPGSGKGKNDFIEDKPDCYTPLARQQRGSGKMWAYLPVGFLRALTLTE